MAGCRPGAKSGATTITQDGVAPSPLTEGPVTSTCTIPSHIPSKPNVLSGNAVVDSTNRRPSGSVRSSPNDRGVGSPGYAKVGKPATALGPEIVWELLSSAKVRSLGCCRLRSDTVQTKE